MKHLKLTFVGLLALTAAAPDAFAQSPRPPSTGGGPGDAASSAAGNVAAPGLGGNVTSGNVVGGTLTSGGNVTGDRGTLNFSGNVAVFRGSRDSGSGADYRGSGAFAAGATAGAEAESAAASSDKASACHCYPSRYYDGACWIPYYRRYVISFAECAAYTR